jgi:cation:H+ antiporter
VVNLITLSNIFNIPEVIFGYFILAFGTSLPELATLYSSIKKGRDDIGLGSIIGSNMFNVLFVLGLTSIFSTLDLSHFKLELIFVFLSTFLLFLFGYIGKKYYFSKKEGFFLLLFYILFILTQLYYFK